MSYFKSFRNPWTSFECAFGRNARKKSLMIRKVQKFPYVTNRGKSGEFWDYFPFDLPPLSVFPWRLSTTEFYGLRKSGSTKQIRAKTHHSAELSFCGTIKEVFYAPFTPRVSLINLIPLGLMLKYKFKAVANYPPEENAFWYTYLCWILWPFVVLRCKIRSLESWIYERWYIWQKTFCSA